MDSRAVARELENLMSDEADRAMDVFTEALKLPLKDRAAYLDIACHGDGPLRRKVEALLRAHERLGNFLEEPPGGATDD